MKRLLPMLLVVLALGCEREHDARPTVEKFVEALRYGDVDRMYELHIDSTPSTQWCREEFRNLLAKARDSINSEECQRVRAIGPGDLEKMKDEVRLAFQVTGWVCEQPDGDCEQYAETVFR